MKEFAEIILRTTERFDKIKHLPRELRRHLMKLSEEEFNSYWEDFKEAS